VVEIRVLDGRDRPVEDLGKGDFLINKGKVAVEAAAEVRYEPAVLFVIEDTVRSAGEHDGSVLLGTGGPNDLYLFYARVIGEVCSIFPEGVTAYSFLGSRGVVYGRAKVGGESVFWAPNRALGRILEKSPEVLIPQWEETGERLVPEDLPAWLQWSGDRFVEVDGRAYRRILVFLSEERTSHPYDLSPTTAVGLRLWIAARDSSSPLAAELRRRAAYSAFVFCGLNRQYLMELLGRAGHGDHPFDLGMVSVAPGGVRPTLAERLGSLLHGYRIAWRASRVQEEGDLSLKIKVRGRRSGRAVPNRLGRRTLESRNPYWVRHIGPPELMPWADYLLLFPQEAEKLAGLAEIVDENNAGATWQQGEHCPFLLAPEEEAASLGPLLLSAYKRTHEPPWESLESLWAETAAFLAEPGVVDLCLYAARLKRASW
jgi:hypothetical protein